MSDEILDTVENAVEGNLVEIKDNVSVDNVVNDGEVVTGKIISNSIVSEERRIYKELTKRFLKIFN